jgi:hypothetical protein
MWIASDSELETLSKRISAAHEALLLALETLEHTDNSVAHS